jgi:hypothetical protein
LMLHKKSLPRSRRTPEMIHENTSLGVPVGDFAEAWPDGDFLTIYQRKLSS